MNNWLGPFKTADDAIDALRRSVAEIIGADPDTWPDHKNAPLVISAVVGLREGAIKQLRKERDAMRAELDALRGQKDEALNTLCKVFHAGEEFEGQDGMIMAVDLALWNEGCEAIERLVGGEEDGASPYARPVPAQSVPEGWKLVPIEPTEDMMEAMTDFFIAINGDCRKAFAQAYKAMLATAPEAKP